MPTIDEEYLTVAEAAALLRVAPSTIRRWVREGDLPAYRLGRRRVGLKRGDLSAVVSPVRPGAERSYALAGDEPGELPRLTEEQKQQALAAMDRVEEINQRILARRGGKPFPPAWQIINEMRDERTRELP